MYLVRTGSDSLQPNEPSEEIIQFNGQWNGVNSSFHSGSEIDIKVLFDDLFYIKMEAHNGTATGAVEGLATYQNGIATIIFSDIIPEEGKDNNNVAFNFQIKENELLLEANQYDYLCGMGVSFDDRYTRDELNTSVPTLLGVGIVDTLEQQELFLEMVDYDYYKFCENTQYVIYEDIILNGKKARAGESYLRGASGTCYYINASEYLYAAIYVDDHIEYYTNDLDYADHMPEPMKEWSDKYDTEIIFNEVTAPSPFDSEIPDLLIDQMKQIKTGKQITLPEHYSLMDHAIGDLNQDGKDDIAVVIEQGKGVYSGSRGIFIFLNKNGTYKLTYENRFLILGRSEGGIFGDPYYGISLSDGKFYVSDYGGSVFRWSHTYTFSYKDQQLNLTQIEISDYYTHTYNGIYSICDLIAGEMETRTFVDLNGNSDTYYNELLLCSKKLETSKVISIQDAYAGCEDAFNIERSYPMPSLGYYNFGRDDLSGVQYSAEEILDKVQQKYYPQMKKVKLPCSQEIIDNYSLLLGYKVPSYYYSDGESVLYYFQLELNDESNRYEHTIFYESDDKGEYNFYYYWDDTGEELTFE